MSHARGSAVRHIVTAVATTVAMLAVDAGTALAADGQPLCIDGPSRAVTSPSADGDCRRGETLTTLATQSDVAALQAKVGALEAENESLDARVGTLETQNATLTTAVGTLQDKLSTVSFDATGLNGRPTLKISRREPAARKRRRRDGHGQRPRQPLRRLRRAPEGGNPTGSHNLVLGTNQSFTSYGGLLAGNENSLSGPFSVVFGTLNKASGRASSVTGGGGNAASGSGSTIGGGIWNQASGNSSFIGGGQNSDATAQNASVLGGSTNLASGFSATVSGGYENVASEFSSSVSGGRGNTASGYGSSILGGRSVTVSTGYGTSP